MAGMRPLKLPSVSSTRDYSSIDPLDGRYYDPAIAQYLSERSRIAYQAHVEIALAYTLAEHTVCSLRVAQQIEKAAQSVSAEAVYEAEKLTRHDIKALGDCIKATLPDSAKPYVHFGATSYDIICTASALQLRDGMQKVVLPRLNELLQTLVELSETYALSVQIGRTHGQHAVPITFGFAIAEYVSRLGHSITVLTTSTHELYGKFSGAVGSYNALSMFITNPQDFEKKLLARLHLKPAPYSTQIIPAENTVRLLDELSLTAGIMANLANDMRHLQRSEIGEIRERFEVGQTGSSTMAHKRNPWNFENVVSMNKQVSAQIMNAHANLSSEHQRDLTDSASSRFYALIPASVAAMTTRLHSIMSKIEVDEPAMERNLALTNGAIAAEPLYLLFAKYGHSAAHEKSKELAHHALEHHLPLTDVIMGDKDAAAYWNKFTTRERNIIASPEKFYTGIAAKKATQVARQWKHHA